MVNPKHHDSAPFQMPHVSVLNLLLSGGRQWLRNLFFNEDSNISPMIFNSQTRFEHKVGTKRSVNFTFHETKGFFNSFLNSFLDINEIKKTIK